jgi:hypothetical protein
VIRPIAQNGRGIGRLCDGLKIPEQGPELQVSAGVRQKTGYCEFSAPPLAQAVRTPPLSDRSSLETIY